MADLPPTDPEQAIAELRARIATLETELADERRAAAERGGELSELQKKLAELLTPKEVPGKKADGFYLVDDDKGE